MLPKGDAVGLGHVYETSNSTGKCIQLEDSPAKRIVSHRAIQSKSFSRMPLSSIENYVMRWLHDSPIPGPCTTIGTDPSAKTPNGVMVFNVRLG